MAEGNDIEEISKLPFEERLKFYEGQEVVDISNGLKWLTHDSNELISFLTSDTVLSQGRIPIIGTKEGKTYMLSHPQNRRSEHRSILSILNINEQDVSFSTSFEAITSTARSPFVEMTATKDLDLAREGDKIRVMLGKGSDLPVPGILKEAVTKLFEGISGVNVII